MNKCAWCLKFIWPWQKMVLDMAGYEHRACYQERWRGFMERGSMKHLQGRERWEAVLTMPSEFVEQAMREIDESPNA